MHVPWLLSGVLTLFLIASSAGASPFLGPLEPGPHAVGFRVLDVVDPGRELGGLKDVSGRPIRLFLWYPVQPIDDREPMRFGEYFEIPATRPELAPYYRVLHERELDVLARQFSAKDPVALVEQIRSVPTLAYRDALPAAGKYPLVIHLLGRNDYQQESTVLWELLAGHGYLVAVVPQMGKSLKSIGMKFTRKDLEYQLGDAAHALRQMARAPFVDPERIAVIGHSSGAVIGAMLASRSNDIGALASLDGSILRGDGIDILREWNVDEAALSLPVLNLYGPSSRLDRSFVDDLVRCRVFDARFARGLHFDFQNWPLYAFHTGEADDRVQSFRSTKSGRDIYLTACRLTLAFLDYTLKKDRSALDLLAGTRPALPGSKLKVTFGSSR